MSAFAATFSDALSLLAHFDHTVLEIVALSLQVSGAAVVLGTLIGLPLGACIAVGRFPGKTTLSVFQAHALAQGPLAQMRLPYGLPLGLHGQFVAG